MSLIRWKVFRRCASSGTPCGIPTSSSVSTHTTTILRIRRTSSATLWIGYEALIMPGVKIGNGAIISSRSVVVADVPAYAIVGGNPAKTIRPRFEPDIISALEKLAWWDWPVDKITEHLELIVSNDVEALLRIG